MSDDEREQRTFGLVFAGRESPLLRDNNSTAAPYLFSTWLDNIFSTGLIFVSKLTFFSIGSIWVPIQSFISASAANRSIHERSKELHMPKLAG